MPTLRELICQGLASNGVQQATAVKLSYPDGTSFTIHSDDHPALDQPIAMGNAPKVEAAQSAQGGN